jgi:hypothetical protein
MFEETKHAGDFPVASRLHLLLFFFEIIHGPGNMGEIIINSLRGEKVNTRN